MLKNFKSLFIKTDDEEEEVEKKPLSTGSFSFPVDSRSNEATPAFTPTPTPPPAPTISDPVISEVIKVYESGLESINMPGYDFFEFYQSVNIAGSDSEQAYKMAYQIAKTMDKAITPEKLGHDAEFYISKINEVYSQYVSQGQAKLNGIQDKKSAEKSTLTGEIDQATRRIDALRAELTQLEAAIADKKTKLSKIDESYYSQEKSIKEKLSANDFAKQSSIEKINKVKEGILRYVRG
jgi:hypothetical protein